jgi:hypothetical protein
MDINYIMVLAIAIIMAIAYGILGFFADKLNNNGIWDWSKFVVTIIYSIVIGVAAVVSGAFNFETIANWQAIFSPMWATYFGLYMGMMYFFQKFIVPIFTQITTKTKFYPRKAGMGIRKMDPESRGFLTFDLPEWAKKPTLGCVDAAEAVNQFQYAIQSASWIFLIENGELTGAKHYWFRGWFGSGTVDWKPISAKCLEDARKSGRIPDYGKLY